METEPLEVIVVIALMTIVLFSIYNYNRTSVGSQGLLERELRARNIASVIAGNFTFQYVNGTLKFNEFNNSLRRFIERLENRKGVHIFVNMSFIYPNGTTCNFTLYRSSGAGKMNFTASVPAVINLNESELGIKPKLYVLPYTMEPYYEDASCGLIREGADLSNLVFFVIANYPDGSPANPEWVEKFEYEIHYKCRSLFNEKECSVSGETPPIPIMNGGAILNLSSLEVCCPLLYSFEEITEIDVTVENCSSDLSDCNTLETYSLSPQDSYLPQISLNTSYGHVIYLYQLGQKIELRNAPNSVSWSMHNRKGETLSGTGNIVPLDPMYSYREIGDPAFFVQGPFNLTVIDSGHEVHIPFYILPHVVIFRVMVSW